MASDTSDHDISRQYPYDDAALTALDQTTICDLQACNAFSMMSFAIGSGSRDLYGRFSPRVQCTLSNAGSLSYAQQSLQSATSAASLAPRQRFVSALDFAASANSQHKASKT